MKKHLIIYILLGIVLNAQDLNLLKKLEEPSKTPGSNVISKIFSIDNSIWVHSGKYLNKSDDKGKNWEKIDLSKINEESNVMSVSVFKDIILCSFYQKEDDIYFGKGLVYSTDKGKNWTKISQPVESVKDTLIEYGNNLIKNKPFTSSNDLVGLDFAVTPNNTIWVANYGGGLWKSMDLGKKWQKVLLPPDVLDSIKPEDKLNFTYINPRQDSKLGSWNFVVYTVKTIGNDTIIIGTERGVNISTDSGISWKKITSSNRQQSISGNRINDLNYNPADRTLWVISNTNTSSEYASLGYSKDLGESWVQVLAGKSLTDISFKGREVLVTSSEGLFRSDDYGNTWIEEGKIYDKFKRLGININNYNTLNSVKLNDGTYNIWVGSSQGLAMKTETANSNTGDWNVFFTSSPLESKNSTYAFPNPFRPNLNPVNIKYHLNNAGAKVTIRIMDFGMNLVRIVIQNSTQGIEGDNITIWDGKDERGNYVPNGVYFYRIDVDSGDPMFGKIVVYM